MNWALALLTGSLLFTPGQIPVTASADFSKEQQIAAVLATVRIRNTAQNKEGSGTLIGASGGYVYILTAHHLIKGAERCEAAVFSTDSYPNPVKIYRSAEVVSEKRGLADLALLRIRTADAMPAMLRVRPDTKAPKGKKIAALSVGCDVGKAPTVMVEKATKITAKRLNGTEIAPFWEVNRKYAPGRSGGPLIDQTGRLTGVCSGTNQEKTYFTHLDDIHTFLKNHGYRWLMQENTEK